MNITSMTTTLQPIDYSQLNARQKECYNFQKVSALLADYGFATIRLSSDWQGADFIAQHLDGTFLKVQLKGRLVLDRKYEGQNLYLCFRDGAQWYLYPHDEVMTLLLASTEITTTDSWQQHGGYSWPGLSLNIQKLLAPWRLLTP